MPGLAGLLQHGTAAGDGQHHIRVSLSSPAQSRQVSELAEGKVRVTQRHHIHPVIASTVEFAPTAQQVLQADFFHGDGSVRIQHLRRVNGLRGDPGDVEQWRRRGGGEGRAKGFEVVQARLAFFQSQHQRHATAGQGTNVVTQQRVEGIVQFTEGRHLDLQPSLALRVQVAADQRGTTAEGDADVQVIRVFEGACTEHAVGVDHGVRFRPDDLLASLRCSVEQVRRAGETELCAHRHIGIAQGTGRFTQCRVDTQFTPTALVDGN
ncbi:hypothetical protein D9M73_160810 [compost metagenome]